MQMLGIVAKLLKYTLTGKMENCDAEISRMGFELYV